MKNKITILFLLIFSFDGYCQGILDSLYPIRKANLYGFVDKYGNLKIQPIYSQVNPFQYGIAKVRDTFNIEQYINALGEVIYEVPDGQIDFEHFFSEGLLPAYDTKKKKWGYINTKGKWVIKPKFNIARNFYSNRAIVSSSYKTLSNEGWCGTKYNQPIYYIINKNGKEINRDWGYYRISDFYKGYAFIDDTVAINLKARVVKNSSITDEDVLDRQFEYNYAFKRYLRDEKGMGLNFEDYNLQRTLFYYYNSKSGKYGITNRNGDRLTEDIFDGISKYHDGVVAYKVNNKWGLLDSNLKVVIEPTFDFISDFSDGFAYVKKNKKYGIINNKGEFVIEPKYDVPYEHCSLRGINNIFPFVQDEKYILINLNHEYIWNEE